LELAMDPCRMQYQYRNAASLALTGALRARRVER
jgi:hypothetical protein